MALGRSRHDAGHAPFREMPTDSGSDAEQRIIVIDDAGRGGEHACAPSPAAGGRGASSAAVRADRRARLCVAFGVALVAAMVLGILLPNEVFTPNNTRLSLAWWLETFQQNVVNAVSLVLGQDASGSVEFTVNRYVIVALAGAALGLSGAVYQGALKNALASPSTLGVMGGAVLGVTLYALFFISNESSIVAMDMGDAAEKMASLGFFEYLASMQGQALSAVAGAGAVACLVVGVAYVAGRGRISSLALIITGQVVMALIGSFNQLIRYHLAYTAPDSPQSLAMRYLQTTAFSSSFTLWDVIALGVPVVAGIAVIMALRAKLNLLAFDEDEARTLGVAVNRIRFAVVAITTVLTAFVVAFCGQIGFVGFFIPHLTRKIIGPDFRFLLPASALLGALFLVVSYHVSTLFGVAASSGIGLFTSIIGGVVFVWLLVRERGRAHADWL